MKTAWGRMMRGTFQKPVWAKFITAAVLLTLLVSLALPAYAGQTQAQRGSDVIFVAGNPDLYPVEYYDKDAEKFDGIMPRILERVAEDTGLTFQYVNDDQKDSQQRVAKNKQAELLTAYVSDPDIDPLLSGRHRIIALTLDGEKVDVCIAFTDIAPASLKSRITESLNAISGEELADIILSYSMDVKPTISGFLLAMIFAVILLAVGIAAMVYVLRKRKRETDALMLTDSETGMGNMAYFEKYYASYITDHNRNLYHVAYIGFDIGWVNQHLGKEVSSQVLKDAAAVMLGYGKDTDILAKVSGGGFAMAFLSSNLSDAAESVERLVNRLNRILAEYNVAFHAGIYSLGSVNCSCETALSNAEKGFRQAQREQTAYVFSSDRLLRDAGVFSKLQEQTMSAVQKGEFRPYLQMTVDAQTRQFVGGEMLSRWQNPEYGLLMPGKYISMLEEAGTITDLDYFMFEQGCRYLQHCSESGRENFTVSCNFSRHTISQPEFFKRLTGIASKYSFRRDRFILEITEQVMESNKEAALYNARQCKEFGFQLALDDLGSGYTSFMNLCEYPIDIVKIDRVMVVHAAQSQRGAQMMKAIITMAHDMGLKVLCEGVETDEQDALVKQSGTDYIQGFRYSRVLPLEETDAFLNRFA